MRPVPCLTVMPIVRNPVPHEGFLKRLLAEGVQCLGGFPLWLIGGADTYSDIDLYSNDWTRFYRLHKEFSEKASSIRHTRRTSVFVIDKTEFQLVKAGFRQFTDMEMISMTDMSATAVMLRLSNDQLEVVALYPDDIRSKVSHLLLDGSEWTEYRVQQMERKGYTVIRDGAITA